MWSVDIRASWQDQRLRASHLPEPQCRAPATSPRKEKIPKDASTATCSRGSLWSEAEGQMSATRARLPDQFRVSHFSWGFVILSHLCPSAQAHKWLWVG